MSDCKFGKAVFIAVSVILAKPSLAQSPAMNQAAMTFAVEKKLFVCRQPLMGFLFVFWSIQELPWWRSHRLLLANLAWT